MVTRLVNDLLGFVEVGQVLLTLNVPEVLSVPDDPRVLVLSNVLPRGFGANHNSAFALCDQPFFCVLNPDVEFYGNPFPVLLESSVCSGAAVVAPLVKSRTGEVEDSVRRFPTVMSVLRRVLGEKRLEYELMGGAPDLFPDWVAGMFMLFKSECFARLKGFDESFYLYYEDVDICVRTWQSGMKVMLCPRASIMHDARRDSRKSLRYLKWHAFSMVKYFSRHGCFPRSMGMTRSGA